MNNLKNLNNFSNQELLTELQNRIQNNQINEEQLQQLLEKEIWKKGYKEAAKDTKRWQEAQKWEITQMNDWIKQDEHEDN